MSSPIAESRQDLRDYLSAETSSFLGSGLAEDVIAAALPDARIIEGLVPRVLERFTAILD
ncbi:MAG: hypothetical protein JSW71_07205 [Gemmatimonadota bacterium]|nr:MAG: hypothetical protein JSW71_07205 [Gemmatimonadota bacterium]